MSRMTETQVMRANHELNSKLVRMLSGIFKPGSFVKDLEGIEDNCDYDYEKPKLGDWAATYFFEAVRLGVYGYGIHRYWEMMNLGS